jgi:hypothetical protein
MHSPSFSCVRVPPLSFIFYAPNRGFTLQIDRHNTYRELSGLYFPHHENPVHPLRSTIADGELVVDVDPSTKRVRFALPHVFPAALISSGASRRL